MSKRQTVALRNTATGKTGTDVSVDTCVRIEWMIDSPLAKSYSRYLTSTDTLIVPTLAQHELYK